MVGQYAKKVEHSNIIYSKYGKVAESYWVILTYLPLSSFIKRFMANRTWIRMQFNMHYDPIVVHKVYVHDSSMYKKEVCDKLI